MSTGNDLWNALSLCYFIISFCDNIVDKWGIDVLKWPQKFDWSRSLPITEFFLSIWFIGISPIIHIGHLWGFKRRRMALSMSEVGGEIAPPCRHPELLWIWLLLEDARLGQRRSTRAAARPMATGRSNGAIGWWLVGERDRRQWRGLKWNRPLAGNPSWVGPDSCLQVLGTDKDRDVTLPYGRRRLALVQ
jgi:hypothetical protein